MEEPAGPIHWSMGKRAVVWIVGAEADVSACPYSAGCQVLPGRLSSVASLIRHLEQFSTVLNRFGIPFGRDF